MMDDPKLLWYVNRASGLVLLVLFTVVILLGQYSTRRTGGTISPRFVWLELHRNLSLLSLVMLAVHVGTSVADDYVDISLLDVVIPFASPYRRFWLGLGTIAVDLLVALAVTTALRHRLPYRGWLTVHRLAYLMWPVSVVHGLGSGTDALGSVALAVTVGCAAAVLVGALLRVRARRRERWAAEQSPLADLPLPQQPYRQPAGLPREPW